MSIYSVKTCVGQSDLKWLLRTCFPCCRRLTCCLHQDPSTMAIARGASVRVTINGDRHIAAVCRIHGHASDSPKLAIDGGGIRRYGTAAIRADVAGAGRDGHRASKSTPDLSPAFSRSSFATAATELSPLCSVKGPRGTAKIENCSAGSSSSSSSSAVSSAATGAMPNRLQLVPRTSLSAAARSTAGSAGRLRWRTDSMEAGKVGGGESVQMTVIASGPKATTVVTTCDGDRGLFD